MFGHYKFSRLRTCRGFTPLHVASEIGWPECAFNLVHRGASLCASDTTDMYDPSSSFSHWSSCPQQIHSVTLRRPLRPFRYCGEDLHASQTFGCGRPLVLDQCPRSVCCLRFFIPTRLRPVRVVISPNSLNQTPLELAAGRGHLETVRALLRQGATVFSDGLLDKISRIAQAVVARPNNDLLRLRENWKDISFALGRVLLIQRYDAEQPLTPRLTATLQSQDFSMEDWRAVNAHLGITSIADIPMLPIEEVERSLSRASVSVHQRSRAVLLWLQHMPSAGR